jgi:hypothetical protein
MRSFDPVRVGELECAAWVGYYRRRWAAVLRAAVGLTRHTFGMSWPATIRGAWLVLRANQRWAPYLDNDPEGARRRMQRFYQLVGARNGEPFDASEAARLEVEWWRVHRERQHDRADDDDRPLVDALAAAYAHLYGVSTAAAHRAAEQRALAMRISDRWVAGGCSLGSPLIADERAALLRSYAALLAVVHRPD